MSFNLGDVLERGDQVLPADTETLVCGDRRLSRSDLARRSNNLARTMLAGGAQTGDKVAFYLRNGNEYMETLTACLKARLIHVNVNYRYTEDELLYIFDNSDAAVVVFAPEFRDRIEPLLPRLSKVKLWLEIGDEAPATFAQSYEQAAETGDGEPLDIERSPDDLLFLYTGGTTGNPKGVMWPHGSLFHLLTRNRQLDRASDLEQFGEMLRTSEPGARQLPACPMMHGTGLFTAIGTLLTGGCVVSLPSPRFDPEQLWAVIEKEKVSQIAIVGDAFAKPMVNALDANPGRWDISSLAGITSSGVMWSSEVKQGLLKHNEHMRLIDTFGSSEALGFGASVTSKKTTTAPARFALGENARVFDDNQQEIEPGSDKIGFIGITGNLPIGYYKDEEKSARTFPVIDGVRYSMPGDYCRVLEDGTLVLLGRGSACINSAGEKIYAEEVEEALKEHPGIVDALVFGIDDDRWGQAVTAVVQPAGADFDEADVQQFLKGNLASYKVPKRIFATDDMGRAANGKANYDLVRRYALRQIAG